MTLKNVSTIYRHKWLLDGVKNIKEIINKFEGEIEYFNMLQELDVEVESSEDDYTVLIKKDAPPNAYWWLKDLGFQNHEDVEEELSDEVDRKRGH